MSKYSNWGAERASFGINITKRYVSEGGEEQLYRTHEIGNNGKATLIDYMGGDPVVERVATAGHGRDIFPESVSNRLLLEYLVARGIQMPFKFSQIKVLFEGPISMALDPVYFQPASVNEMSGRYSVMPDTAHLPNEDEVYPQLKGTDRSGHSRTIAYIISKSRRKSLEGYRSLLDSGLTRELSRGVLGTNNDTKFVWKIDMWSLADVIKMHRARQDYKFSRRRIYLEKVAEIASTVFPNAWHALIDKQVGEHVFDLTFPRDNEVVDGELSSPAWKPKKTRRVVVPDFEKILFSPVTFLGNGNFQVTDYMGDDNAMAEAARTSYSEGTKKAQTNKRLVRSLIRDEHTSPIEMAEMASELKFAVFTDPRQLRRHRMLDAEGFMGYIPIGDEYYMPSREEFRTQSLKNRQGRAELLDKEEIDRTYGLFERVLQSQLKTARELRDLGTPEHLVREQKGVFFFTRISRTGDLHNFAHFLKLRLHKHAQMEARTVAGLYDRAYKSLSPTAHNAQMDYNIKAIKLSSEEQRTLSYLIKVGDLNPGMNFDILKEYFEEADWLIKNKETGDLEPGREAKEFLDKLKTLIGRE